jgi:3-methyladenine DNA glycosylase AlkD
MSTQDVLNELEALRDPRMLEVNRRHGDEHAVNLTALRGLAKHLGKDAELAEELWASGSPDARLLALLMVRPSAFSQERLDVLLREARLPKVQDWLVNYVVKKSKHAPALRELWLADPDPVVESAGWALTSEAIAKGKDALDHDALLATIEARMQGAPERLQWAMNQALATIGIEDEARRGRASDIGERLGVLKDYPVAPGCISPFAPIWIAEMSARKEG